MTGLVSLQLSTDKLRARVVEPFDKEGASVPSSTTVLTALCCARW